jgi:hypothetical protein
MFDRCFVMVNPIIMIVIALLLTLYAIYRIFTVFRGEKTAFFVITLFLVMTAISFIFMHCWEFSVSIIELVIASYLSNQKLLILKTN